MRPIDWIIAGMAVWLASLATYGFLTQEKPPRTERVCIALEVPVP